ncbi:MAG: 2Fe-2S iron-sulfur cluster-binding protein [Hydrotalea sp.]|nr:2Fe-2S iron-sulfur cluster-binding protein [Hydrotalea sp.]
MKQNIYRLPKSEEFGWGIQKDQPLGFDFDGKRLTGFYGDSVASALLGQGISLVGRSFKYHRPRGILSAGVEEPNALVTVSSGGGGEEVNARATMSELVMGQHVRSQNRYPSLKFDLLAVNSGILAKIFPAGFYYKTFKFPRRFWESFYEPFIRRAAGLGKVKNVADIDSYATRHIHVDYLVVGGGMAGLLTALNLAMATEKTGEKILLADEDWHFGGYLHQSGDTIDGKGAMKWVAEVVKKLSSYKHVTLLPRTTITALYDHQFLTALEKVTDHLPHRHIRHLPRQRFWKIRAKQVILATGSLERPLCFPDNDRPGVMMAGAVAEYLKRYAVLPGRHVAFITNNDSVYEAAKMVLSAGRMASVIDVRPKLTHQGAEPPRAALMAKVKAMGGRVLEGATIENIISEAGGMRRIKKIIVNSLVAVDSDENTDKPSKKNASKKMQSALGNGMGLMIDKEMSPLTLECDVVAMSGGFVPTVHLYSQGRGQLRYDEKLCAFLPDKIPQACEVVGGVNGTTTLSELAGDLKNLFKKLGVKQMVEFPAAGEKPRDLHPAPIFILPGKKPIGHGKAKHFADFQNDVTVADWQLAVREGYDSVELLKRYTTTGMATDQGKTSNLNALHFLAHHLGLRVPEVGITTFRPPYSTQTFGALAGHNVGTLFQQSRQTAMHPEHLKAQVVFENVGDWLRPWYFLRAGENMHQAVMREVKATRDSLGVLDASTLGKIDIQGPDALKLLNLVYTNGWDNLKIGQCRYGLMLNENGMVFDDGVTTRLGENHYHMTTTTGGAGRVMNWLEEWLQTEYPTWKVYCTSVTEQWAVASIAGPNARLLLQEISDSNVDNEAFPHMTMKKINILGIPARVFRISFTGELSFEINVPARYGRALWQGLMAHGKKYNITPYGTEAMHVLRAEKGYIIVGQDTDGMVTPDDLGLGGMISKKKPDFLGKRSLYRPDTARPDRRHLVGLLPRDGKVVLREGAQVVKNLKRKPPMDMVGYVTSAYDSPNAGRSIAMGLIKNGRNLIGQELWVPVMGKKAIRVTVTEPIFWDKENRRMT